MLDSWMELPAWIRLVTALALLVIGGLVFWYVSWKLGVAIGAVGLVLVLFSEKSKGEKGGYRF